MRRRVNKKKRVVDVKVLRIVKVAVARTDSGAGRGARGGRGEYGAGCVGFPLAGGVAMAATRRGCAQACVSAGVRASQEWQSQRVKAASKRTRHPESDRVVVQQQREICAAYRLRQLSR